MHSTNYDILISLKDIVKRYLKEKDIDVHNIYFIFKNSIKNLAEIDDRMNILAVNVIELEDKKMVVSILNLTRNNLLDFYTCQGNFFKLAKIYSLQRVNKTMSRYSN